MNLRQTFSFAAKTLAASLLMALPVMAQSGPPGSDIYVADLSKNAKGHWRLRNFQQITTRKGYDNQPFFLPDGSGILYTAMYPVADGNFQSDSYEYNFASKKHKNLTNSPESEYSPILMNNGESFSTITVEKDGSQKLWAFPFRREAKPYRIMDLAPVGYHVWGKNGDIAMFVLGKPHTLQYKKRPSGKAKVVAKDIGRSLRYTAKRNAFSFTEKKADGKWWLSEYQPKKNKTQKLVPMPKDAGYYTWINANWAVTSVAKVLHLWSYKNDGHGIVEDWVPWVNVSDVCKTNVSRLAVNHNQTKLAFVCDE